MTDKKLSVPIIPSASYIEEGCKFIIKQRYSRAEYSWRCTHPKMLEDFYIGHRWRDKPDGPLYDSKDVHILNCEGCKLKDQSKKEAVKATKLLRLKLQLTNLKLNKKK